MRETPISTMCMVHLPFAPSIEAATIQTIQISRSAT
jgi:hypothetical protein